MSTNRTLNRLRPLRRIAASVVMAGTLAAMATACEPPGCAKDCVTSVAFNPGVTNTKIVTTDKAKVNVTVYSDSGRKTAVLSRSSNVFATSHSINHGSISPNRTYWYTVTATDEAGKAWKELGSFKAQKRTLALKITRIKLVDDSDSAGSGELRFGMKVTGTKATDFGAVYTNGDMSSGTDKSGLSIIRTIPNDAASFFTVAVEGVDDDCEGIGSLCIGGSAFSYSAGGSNDDADWATATSAKTTLPATNGSGSWTATTSGYPVKFTVSGTWTVTYSA
jgi:hypothetical protein